tara:strand:+ start:2318 stop:3976 length:1659 start_codon:yes stop_codon:yes gene_type:complete
MANVNIKNLNPAIFLNSVGIGTSAPSSPNSVNRFLHMHDSDHCSLVMSDDSNTWEIVSNLGLTFRDGTDTRMTVTSDGRVDVDSILQTGLLYHNVLQFFHNGTISNGVKIKTNFPFDGANENAMPTIIIEGYDYRGARTIGLQIAWYPYSSSFIQGTVSSFGSYTPVVKLARESDKVIIHLGTDETDWYYGSFNVKVLHNFVNSDQSSELIGWTWADEAITGDRIATLTYNNKVGNLTTEGNVAIGTTSLSNRLTVKDGNSLMAFAEYNNGANIWLDGSNGDLTGGDYYNILADGATALRFGYGGANKISMLANGHLGLGTQSPSTHLHISASAPKIRLQDSNETNVYTEIFNDSGDTFFRSRDGSSNGIFTFNGNNGTSDTEYLRIDSNGASYFYGQLNIPGGSGSTTNRLNFNYNSSNGVAEIAPDSSGGNTELKFSTCLSGTKSERMRIKSDGTVHLASSSNNTLLKIDGNSATTKGIRIQSENDGGIIYAANPSVAALRFGVTADDSSITEAMRIDDAGRIKIANLPTSDPGVAGVLYRDGSDVKISI